MFEKYGTLREKYINPRQYVEVNTLKKNIQFFTYSKRDITAHFTVSSIHHIIISLDSIA